MALHTAKKVIGRTQTVDNRSLVLFLSGLAAAGASVCIAVSCSDQPKVKCVTARGPFTALYNVVSGPEGGCLPGQPPGEVVGVQSYNPPNSDRTNADLSKGSMAIKGASMSDAVHAHDPPRGMGEDTAHKPYSAGDFKTNVAGDDNFCDVVNLTVAEQNLPFIPGVPAQPPPPDAGPDATGTPALDPIPGQNIKYEWTSLRSYVTAAFVGTQLVGDLKYTITTTADDGGAGTPCESTYRVRALFPSYGCGFDTSAVIDGGPTIPDDGMCAAAADITHTVTYNGMTIPNPQAVGSGINPDLAVKCDPVLMLCVLTKEPPAFK
jgi:hypothetical protein